MNAERLLEVYEQISEAPDAIARLRRFVLDLAVRGKLVEQDAADEPASQLLEQIAVEKAKLVSSGHIKAPKPQKTKSAIEADFAIPSGWVWTSLGTVAACLDFMRKPINGTERDKRIDGLPQDKLYPYFGATQQQGWIDDFIFDDDLILLGEDGVPFHDPLRNKAYKISGKTWVNNHAHVFKCILTSIDLVAHYLNVFDYSGRVVGATRAKLNQARALTIPIPLPPLAEQHRIVAKVDELLALCDRLEEARKTREELRDKLTAASLARLTAPDTTAQAEPAKVGTGFASGPASSEDDFPTHAAFVLEALPALTTRPDQIKTLRQTILNLAVRGKLVKQDPADEPASELLRRIAEWRQDAVRNKEIRLPRKPLNPISDGEAPYDLPYSWAWARIGELIYIQSGDGLTSAKMNEGPIPVYGGNGIAGYHDAANTYEPTIVIGRVGYYCGSIHVTPDKAWITDNAFRTKFSNAEIFQDFLELLLNATDLKEQESATAQPVISGSKIYPIIVGLPPLTEQHRIVAKVDALMALCDRLEAALTTADTTRTRLLEALLHEALNPVADTLEAAE
ncbi:restriction endonuclease subunit S [Tritonibacter scottomollicae]|uniref:restriction endonuclease subunit S n=1 Tax=Tritonibacter scottomollicae TaxID=483013 RepID=UPI003AA8FF97